MNRAWGKILLAIFLLSGAAWATPITFIGSSGNLAASATFSASGTNLVVTLTNTSAYDVLIPAEVLTAVFFDVWGNPPLSPVSASLNGSVVWFGPDGGGNVGGEWAYASGLSGAPLGALRGISSAGFGLFGSANFGGPNLQDPLAVDGLNYGITSAGDNVTTGNTPVTGGSGGNPVALIQNSVVFTLSGLPVDFNPALGIWTVSFQYGTSLTEPNLEPPDERPPIPEPGSLLLVGGALLFAGVLRRRLHR